MTADLHNVPILRARGAVFELNEGDLHSGFIGSLLEAQAFLLRGTFISTPHCPRDQ